MNIAISDSCSLKFLKEVKEHWEKNHEVKYEMGGSEFLAQWADLYYIDWFDNNVHYLFNWYKENPQAKKPKFAIRVIDVDIWQRGVRDQAMVDFVDYWICIGEHLEDWLRKEKDDATGELIDWKGKLHLIKPGVDLQRFTLKEKETDGFQIGMVLGDMWWYKNHMGGLDIFATLAQKDPRWHLHIRGQHEPGQYNPVMYEHYLESRGIKDRVTLYPFVEDMNEWYEQIDILLHPGMKEAFTYAIGETMCKGVRPVANEFFGARTIWPDGILYQTHEQAVKMLSMQSAVAPAYWREYIEENYDMKRMLVDFDRVLEVK